MIVAFDTYYYDGYSYTVGGVFESWTDTKVKYFVTSKRETIDAEYKPGELYKRELPCIMQCLKMLDLDDVDTIIVDGFVWLSENGKDRTPGIGMRLANALMAEYSRPDISIVGIAKNPYHCDIPDCVEILRGESKTPLWITCSEYYFTKNYASLIKQMVGSYRIPDIIKSVDTKTRDISSVGDKKQPKHKTYHIMTHDEWVELGKPQYCGMYVEDK